MTALKLLPFQESVLSDLKQEDALIVLARGLGARSIIGNFLKTYTKSNPKPVIVVNATLEEESGLKDDLGMQLVSIGHEMGSKERERVYQRGGVLSITSRILIVDLLCRKIDIERISGLVILHAELVTPTSIEAFIVRVFRRSNTTGFLKAFSEEPEHFTFGLSPLQTVLTQLRLRTVMIWPRFHASVRKDLEARKPKVIELHQALSPAMNDIQTSIIECMDASLNQIRRANTNLEVDDLTVDNALFRSFDMIIRAQLDPIWHRVSPQTRQLVGDLTTLRKLLGYLLSFDCVTFYQFLETILAANSSTTTGVTAQNQSPWLFTSAADTIFSVAKRRLYENIEKSKNSTNEAQWDWNWLPKGTQPVLEEQPKWLLLGEVLKEIEVSLESDELSKTENLNSGKVVLIMCSSSSICAMLNEYLTTQDEELDEVYKLKPMMRRRLKHYFLWKGSLGKMTRNLNQKSGNLNPIRSIQPSNFASKTGSTTGSSDQNLSEALKRKADYRNSGAGLNKRRRVRGGGAGTGSTKMDSVLIKVAFKHEKRLDSMTSASGLKPIEDDTTSQALIVEDFNEDDFSAYFDLLSTDDMVIIRTYLGDEDDRVLEELHPRYIVMYEPDVAFVRRVECYRASNPGLNVKTYFMMYSDSVEEQRYLSSVRREKEAFERLIRENATMVVPLQAEVRPGESTEEETLRTISSRLGGKALQSGLPQVVVDVREFRSSLPSLLHAANFLVEPTTLIVGDYIISPDMCVERKSISDLIQSFNSGRLYQQCEMMTAHYKQPILLIEFDQKKSFSLDTYKDTRGAGSSATNLKAPSDTDLQAKLVLLTLSFPKLRLIWSSSPQATAEIFREIKSGHPEPDTTTASLIGLDEYSKADKAGNLELIEGSNSNNRILSEEMIRSLPGMNLINSNKILRSKKKKVNNLRELCGLSEREMKNLIGIESGSKLYKFVNEEVDGKS
ncbi:DNA repair protein rad16 [Melampsora larici-populina 98AG31]|uniref:DNA repair protein rad16 n=1 Tax=Melampsora larici-populina (strain 98AG31 / pathotype 3-4-7) TaxID=747676 RepID=F4R2Z7_MELLP|nr:DNA repair protein rad16 [Melampsora larici-populina 98AG31]EGG12539.1 DNA repair protein rad16 [Melampsora larici-populina 98AG31]